MKDVKTLLLSGMLASCIVASATVNAEESKSMKPVGSGPNPFSDCGIGAAIFPKHKVGAVISNVIWDVGTTALTSATASPETCNGKSVETAQFILESYDNLIEETAQGSGEHLTALMDILSIEEAQRDNTVAQLRNKLSHLVSSNDYTSDDKVSKASSFYSAIIASIVTA